MKKTIIVILSVVIIAIAAFVGFRLLESDNDTNKADNGDNQSEYNAVRVYENEPMAEQNIALDTNTIETEEKKQPTETRLYSFSTPIKSDDANRLKNLKITCSRINKEVVKSGKEFSFCDVVGQPSSKDGYKPADAFGANGKVIKAVGGGNCQVSTTVYNAALGVKGLKITERHEHDRDVAYIKDGKDATVAYDYLDLKFKNTNDFDVKLYAYVKNNKVTVKIYKIE